MNKMKSNILIDSFVSSQMTTNFPKKYFTRSLVMPHDLTLITASSMRPYTVFLVFN